MSSMDFFIFRKIRWNKLFFNPHFFFFPIIVQKFFSYRKRKSEIFSQLGRMLLKYFYFILFSYICINKPFQEVSPQYISFSHKHTPLFIRLYIFYIFSPQPHLSLVLFSISFPTSFIFHNLLLNSTQLLSFLFSYFILFYF